MFRVLWSPMVLITRPSYQRDIELTVTPLLHSVLISLKIQLSLISGTKWNQSFTPNSVLLITQSLSSPLTAHGELLSAQALVLKTIHTLMKRCSTS